MENVSLKDYAAQGEEIRSFLYHLKQNQAPHAILISGPEGVGKRTLALLISQYMLCESGNPPCGECRACIQVLKYEHPDQVLIRKGVPLSSEIKEGRATIPVEDIREMIDEGKPVEVGCQFCGRKYTFDMDDLRRILSAQKKR